MRYVLASPLLFVVFAAPNNIHNKLLHVVVHDVVMLTPYNWPECVAVYASNVCSIQIWPDLISPGESNYNGLIKKKCVLFT